MRRPLSRAWASELLGVYGWRTVLQMPIPSTSDVLPPPPLLPPSPQFPIHSMSPEFPCIHSSPPPSPISLLPPMLNKVPPSALGNWNFWTVFLNLVTFGGGGGNECKNVPLEQVEQLHIEHPGTATFALNKQMIPLTIYKYFSADFVPSVVGCLSPHKSVPTALQDGWGRNITLYGIYSMYCILYIVEYYKLYGIILYCSTKNWTNFSFNYCNFLRKKHKNILLVKSDNFG